MTLTCPLSNNLPSEPVFCRVSKIVYEKCLIEKYIQENGSDPITKESCSLQDLIPLENANIHVSSNFEESKTSNISQFSNDNIMPVIVNGYPIDIPHQIKLLQDSYDAMALSLFKAREEISTLRNQLVSQEYFSASSKRVVARLLKEIEEKDKIITLSSRNMLIDTTSQVQQQKVLQ